MLGTSGSDHRRISARTGRLGALTVAGVVTGVTLVAGAPAANATQEHARTVASAAALESVGAHHHKHRHRWGHRVGQGVLDRNDTMYVWESPADIEAGTISADYEPATLIGFASRHRLSSIMVATPWALQDGVWTNTRAWLDEVVERAHEAGIEVFALGGDNTWAAHPELAVQWMQDLTASGIPFDGVNYDVEPWVLPEWTTDRETVKTQLVTMVEQVAAVANRPAVHIDVPWWLASETYQGATNLAAALFAHADGGTVITFVDHALGADGIVALSKPALAAAAEHGLRVPIAVEVSDDIGPEWSFSDDGSRAMRIELAKVRFALAADPAFDGIAVEKYVAWRHLGR
ncbi:hypothetical protein E8D34_08400 [Nocardioides sp. GY 10113]|uniref:hypothetical protein n=1 Tax=Nocardioides sp. GY 10113 TaxID=2569761 RepID=UPI0010A75232|nr:hypothetical protein [Nocardioides sp. GY 10113]TIC87690.1 hypothetical protein E8D34_08400 [Nocardioides sp. GY 10113]